jgi:hypothetical protein
MVLLWVMRVMRIMRIIEDYGGLWRIMAPIFIGDRGLLSLPVGRQGLFGGQASTES